MSDATTEIKTSLTTQAFPVAFETLNVRQEGGVLLAEIAAPPMNLLGPELVRDLVSLIRHAEADDAVQVIVFKSGRSTLNVYRSQYAGTNQATAVTWLVGDDVESVVRALKAKGVVFEHYDLPHMKLEGDIHIAGSMKVAWFKDPDGNILNIINR